MIEHNMDKDYLNNVSFFEAFGFCHKAPWNIPAEISKHWDIVWERYFGRLIWRAVNVVGKCEFPRWSVDISGDAQSPPNWEGPPLAGFGHIATKTLTQKLWCNF
jgi:hypothetical protein